MTGRHTLSISPHVFARGVHLFHALQSEGAGKAGCALHPRSRVQIVQKKAHTSIQVQRRQSDFPCAMVLTAASCSPRRSGFLVTVASQTLLRGLTPASRRQDHTTWPSASQAPLVKSATRVHRIPPRVRDDRDTPLHGDGTAAVIEVICVRMETEYFC